MANNNNSQHETQSLKSIDLPSHSKDLEDALQFKSEKVIVKEVGSEEMVYQLNAELLRLEMIVMKAIPTV